MLTFVQRKRYTEAKIGSYTSVNESEWTLLTGSFMLNEFDISGKSKALINLVFAASVPNGASGAANVMTEAFYGRVFPNIKNDADNQVGVLMRHYGMYFDALKMLEQERK